MNLVLYYGKRLVSTPVSEYVVGLAQSLVLNGHKVHIIGSLDPNDENFPEFGRVFVHGGGDDSESEELKLIDVNPKLNELTAHLMPANHVEAYDEDGEKDLEPYIKQIVSVLESIEKIDLVHGIGDSILETMVTRACSQVKLKLKTPPVFTKIEASAEYMSENEDGGQNATDIPIVLGADPQLTVEKHNALDLLKGKQLTSDLNSKLKKPWDASHRSLLSKRLAGLSPVALGDDISVLQGLLNKHDAERRNDVPDSDLSAQLLHIPWDTAPVIVCSSPLGAGWGIESLIVAMIAVRERHPDAHLVLCGGGPYRVALEALTLALSSGDALLLEALLILYYWEDVRQYLIDPGQYARTIGSVGKSLSAHVHFWGQLTPEMIPALMSRATLAVFPSTAPSLCQTDVLRALNASVPPVLSQVTGYNEVLQVLANFLDWTGDVADLLQVPGGDDMATRINELVLKVCRLLRDESGVLAALKGQLGRIGQRQYGNVGQGSRMHNLYQKQVYM